jgi:peroxiredoxin
VQDRWSIFRIIAAISGSLVVGVSAFLAALIMLTLTSATVRSAGTGGPLVAGSSAPEFELPGPDGNPLKLADLQGDRRFVVFWAGWCQDCKDIVPELNGLHAQGVSVVGVNLMDSAERATSGIQQARIRYPVVLDRDGAVGRAYGVQALPAVFVLDADGRILESSHTIPIGSVRQPANEVP